MSNPDVSRTAAKQCDLCGGAQFEPVADLDRRGAPLETVLCTRCGLVCHGQIPTDEELDAFYAGQYRRQYHGEVAPSARRVVRAWRNGQRIYRQLSPLVNQDDVVFEVGAGLGCNVKAFELHGHEASGIDPGKEFLEFSVNQLRTRLAHRGLYDLPAEPRYDLVLLVHVIEHFNSPRRALEHIHRILKPGGRLYVECPNLAAPFATRGRLFHFAHVHNFTPSSLVMMGRACGFSVARVFSSERDPNLQVLLKREASGRLRVDPHNRGRTWEALRRYNAWTYHLRAGYLARRFAKVGGYLWDHLTARRQLERIVAACQRAGVPDHPATETTRRAA